MNIEADLMQLNSFKMMMTIIIIIIIIYEYL
jgi:uncharacterized membrane protein (DUF106 family)